MTYHYNSQQRNDLERDRVHHRKECLVGARLLGYDVQNWDVCEDSTWVRSIGHKVKPCVACGKSIG